MAKAKGRSPNYPRLSLEKAVRTIKSIHEQAHTSTVNQATVAQAMGYSGLNGAARRNIAALIAYGLLDRKNKDLSVSELSLKILFPKDAQSELSALQTAALNPKLFSTIHEKYGQGTAPVIRSQLICELHFTPDGAKAATNVYLENKEYAKLAESIIKLATSPSETEYDEEMPSEAPPEAALNPEKRPLLRPAPASDGYTVSISGPKVQFSVVVSDETDLTIIDAMLQKVKTFLDEEKDSE